VEVVKRFPEECRFLLETLRVVYVNDSASAGMSPAERLAYHQEHSGPGMEALSKWLHQQIDDKLVEPNSGLGLGRFPETPAPCLPELTHRDPAHQM
jgi:hypothetical protein